VRRRVFDSFIGGGKNQFFDFFLQFNSFEFFWNISGFTKGQQKKLRWLNYSRVKTLCKMRG
jgi:hypothetical protein